MNLCSVAYNYVPLGGTGQVSASTAILGFGPYFCSFQNTCFEMRTPVLRGGGVSVTAVM